MPMLEVEAKVDLKEVLDNALLSDILEEIDPDMLIKEIIYIHGYEAISDHLTLPQLLKALAKLIEDKTQICQTNQS